MAYCLRSDIETIYGKVELAKWADLDEDDVSADIAARITDVILRAENFINDTLRAGPFDVPFSPVPRLIQDLCAYYAGILVYEARGVRDFDPETNRPQHRLHWQRSHVEDQLAGLLAGTIRLNVASAALTDISYPKVVTIADDYSD